LRSDFGVYFAAGDSNVGFTPIYRAEGEAARIRSAPEWPWPEAAVTALPKPGQAAKTEHFFSSYSSPHFPLSDVHFGGLWAFLQ